jgi:hypothetical protein
MATGNQNGVKYWLLTQKQMSKIYFVFYIEKICPFGEANVYYVVRWKYETQTTAFFKF